MVDKYYNIFINIKLFFFSFFLCSINLNFKKYNVPCLFIKGKIILIKFNLIYP